MRNEKKSHARRPIVVAGTAAASLAAALAFAPVASAHTVAGPTATFNKGHRVLVVLADAGGGTITVGRNAAGTLNVNGGAVLIRGGRATVRNVDRIVVVGGAGADRIAIDEQGGPLPGATLQGGGGDDELFGGSGSDHLLGGDGADLLTSDAGNDVLNGGAGNDVLTGGAGTDQARGGAGADQMIWNPGDGSDLDEGGDGPDAVVVNGGDASESFTATSEGARVRFDRVSPLPFHLDIGTSEHLLVHGNGGDDSFATVGDLGPLIGLSVDGGAGNDRISGGTGDDTLFGGPGDDVVDGNQGADFASLGDGNDTFVWDAGDGSDTVEGGAEQDTLVFNGAAAPEKLELSAHGARAFLVRDVGHVSMDLNGIEQVDANVLGGADTVTVDDLSGTDVTGTDVNLTGTPGGSTGDGAGDSVVVDGTAAADTVKIGNAKPAVVAVEGLHGFVRVLGSDGTADALTFNALAGDDTVDATGLSPGVLALTVNGGAGTDVLSGGAGTVLTQ